MTKSSEKKSSTRERRHGNRAPMSLTKRLGVAAAALGIGVGLYKANEYLTDEDNVYKREYKRYVRNLEKHVLKILNESRKTFIKESKDDPLYNNLTDNYLKDNFDPAYNELLKKYNEKGDIFVKINKFIKLEEKTQRAVNAISYLVEEEIAPYGHELVNFLRIYFLRVAKKLDHERPEEPEEPENPKKPVKPELDGGGSRKKKLIKKSLKKNNK